MSSPLWPPPGPGNRFVSFVHAFSRSGCRVETGKHAGFPSALFPLRRARTFFLFPRGALGFLLHGFSIFPGFDPFDPNLDLLAHFEASRPIQKIKLGRCAPKPPGRCSKPLDRRSKTSTTIFENRLRPSHVQPMLNQCSTSVQLLDYLASHARPSSAALLLRVQIQYRPTYTPGRGNKKP